MKRVVAFPTLEPCETCGFNHRAVVHCDSVIHKALSSLELQVSSLRGTRRRIMIDTDDLFYDVERRLVAMKIREENLAKAAQLRAIRFASLDATVAALDRIKHEVRSTQARARSMQFDRRP